LQTPYNLSVTLEVARRKLNGKSVAEIAWRSKAVIGEDNQLLLPFLSRGCVITAGSWQVSVLKGTPLTITEEIMILHYLATADGTPLANRWISFKELPGGNIYTEPFTNRAIKPLVKFFGPEPTNLIQAAAQFQGTPLQLGDVGIMVSVLPMVPVALVLWEGDEEFPATGNILFDASAEHYLPTEDFAVLSGMLVNKLRLQR